MEAHFQGFFAACAKDASAKKRPGKREQHDRAEAASVKRSRRAAGGASSAHAASTDSSAPCEAARADARQLLQEQKTDLRRRAAVAGPDLLGATRWEPPAPALEVWSEKRLNRWMRANNLTEADALRHRPHTFQQEVMDLPTVYAPHNPNSNASS